MIAATTQALFWLALPCSLFYMMILAEFDQRLFGQILPQGLAMKSFLLLGWFGLAVLVYVQWFKLIPQLWRSAWFKSKANTFLPKNP